MIIMLPEEDQFKNIYHQYWRVLYGIANKKTGDHHDALDLVQETFTYVWQNFTTVQQIDDSKVRAYLVTCLYYRVLGFFRARGIKNKHLAFFQLETEHEVSLNSYSTQADAELELNAINLAICGELDRMPERMKEIFLQNHCHDIPVGEIAKAYNISDKTVRNQISIAKNRLKEFAESYPVTELTPLLLLFLVKE